MQLIHKQPEDLHLLPNMTDYAQTCRAFSWDSVRNELYAPDDFQSPNIAHVAVDRHAKRSPGQVAIRWIGKDASVRDVTFRDLRAQTNRFANMLGALNVQKGERVFSLMGRLPEAGRELERVVAARPDFAEAHFNLGLVAEEVGNLEQAEQSYGNAVALRPNFVEALLARARVMQRRGNLEGAKNSLEVAVRLRPHDSSVRAALEDVNAGLSSGDRPARP